MMKLSKKVLIAISLILMFCNQLFPTFGGLSELGLTTLCIFLGTLILLLGVSLTWPTLLMIVAFTFNNVYPLKTVLNMSIGHNIVWLVAFSAVLVNAMGRTGLMRRMSLGLIRLPMMQGHPWRLLCSMFVTLILLGSIMNVSAVTILFVGLAGEILEAVGVKKGDRFGELVMMGVLVFSGLSYCITPIGHPVPMMTIEMMGAEFGAVNYLQYSLVGYLCIFVVFAIYLLISRLVFGMDVSIIRDFDVKSLGEEMPPMSKREKICTVLYILVILFWLSPGILPYISPAAAAFVSKMGELTPLMVVLVVMSLWWVDGKPLMDFDQELKSSIPWGACMSMAAAMTLSSALSNKDAGITDLLAETVAPAISGLPPFMVVLVLCFFCCILTCYASDTMSSVLTCTIFITLYQSGAISGINPAALAIVFGCVSSCGFASPAGSTYGAIVYGSGWMKMKTQMLQGTAYSVGAMLVFSTIGYAIACAIL